MSMLHNKLHMLNIIILPYFNNCWHFIQIFICKCLLWFYCAFLFLVIICFVW